MQIIVNLAQFLVALSLNQNEAWCTTIHIKMSLICEWVTKPHFENDLNGN